MITTKTGLIKQLANYYRNTERYYLNSINVDDIIPTSFVITTNGNEENALTRFIQRYNEFEKGNYRKEHLPEKHCKANWWLVKPANMNQGKGIKVSNKLSDIL